jgi:hypothetical protein
MNYTTLSFQVPAGYEDQVKQLVMTKIEGILSTLLLSPTPEMKDTFNTEMSKVCTDNKVEDTFISKVVSIEK